MSKLVKKLGKLTNDILLVFNRNEVSPDVALASLQCATVSVLDEHFKQGAGDRYMAAMTAFMEAELRITPIEVKSVTKLGEA
jgi:hypothetical protein